MTPTAEPPVAMSNSGFPGCRTISQHLNDLKKENFSLKLRIYFLEEKIQQKFEESSDGVHKRVSENTNDACRELSTVSACCGCFPCRYRLCGAVSLVVFRAAGLCLTVISTDSGSPAALQQLIRTVSHTFLPVRLFSERLQFVSGVNQQVLQGLSPATGHPNEPKM